MDTFDPTMTRAGTSPKRIPGRPPSQTDTLRDYVPAENDCRRLMAIIRAAAMGDTLGTWLSVDGGWRRVEITPETIAEARAALTPEMQDWLSSQSASAYWRRTAARVWPEFAEPLPVAAE